jgi:hypothetical protein
LNRLTTKTPDPFFAAPAVQFTYTFTSRRNSMIDASGTTSYSYNSMDRLITVILGVWADGVDAVPPGADPPGHHTVYPAVRVRADGFVGLFLGLPWRYVYNKRSSEPIRPKEFEQ